MRPNLPAMADVMTATTPGRLMECATPPVGDGRSAGAPIAGGHRCEFDRSRRWPSWGVQPGGCRALSGRL